jgi:hypothetical protein
MGEVWVEDLTFLSLFLPHLSLLHTLVLLLLHNLSHAPSVPFTSFHSISLSHPLFPSTLVSLNPLSPSTLSHPLSPSITLSPLSLCSVALPFSRRARQSARLPE